MNQIEGKGNLKGKILIIESTEYEIGRYENYQLFHDKIYYLNSKKIYFENNFFIMKESDFKNKNEQLVKLIQNFDIIIFHSCKTIKPIEIESFFSAKLKKNEKWEIYKHRSYLNSEKTKIILTTNNFIELDAADMSFMHIDLLEYLKIKEIVYYQFRCIKCEKYNLTILHNTEAYPKKCKYCEQSIFDSNGEVNNNLSILENGIIRYELLKKN